MTAALMRRGPDGEGLRAADGIALGHRRLAIVDLSDRGRQPMVNEDGSIWLVFNGEIYNHRTLRRDLERRGHRFLSDTDSEVLIHSYEDAAENLAEWLSQVRGMFAFGLWDAARHRLVLGRDRLGIKPLVFHLGPSWIAFASDLDSLTAAERTPRRLDWTSVYEYLRLLTVPEPNTIYQDIRALAPGTLMVINQGESRQVRYWSPASARRPAITSADEADAMLERSLAEAVEMHLAADVEVGAFLSGGIDSSIVTAMASERAHRRLRTFAATFPNQPVDESVPARAAAAKIGTVHTEYPVTRGFLDGLEDVVAAMDQPMALTSAVSLFHLSQQARAEVKVVLTGDGGDELFGGYRRHQPYPTLPYGLDRMPLAVRRRLGRVAGAVASLPGASVAGLSRRAKALGSALPRNETELYLPRVFVRGSVESMALVAPDALDQIDTGRYVDRVSTLFDDCPEADPLARRLYVDLQTSLVDEMLAKVDRMTMASALEARVPLLDHQVVEVAMRIPGSLKRDGMVGKRPLRRLVQRRLGAELADRPKSGFNSPLPEWMRTEPATVRRLDELWCAVDQNSMFENTATRELRRSISGGAAESAPTVFALIVLALWAKQRRPVM